jgi:uncharacterized protein YukE
MRDYNSNIELAKKSLEAIQERIEELQRHLKEQRALARSFKNFIEKWNQQGTDLQQPPTTWTKTE